MPGLVIELKYVKNSETKSETTEYVISSKIAEAEEQLIRYSAAENVKSIPNLRRVAAVFSGAELASVKVFLTLWCLFSLDSGEGFDNPSG